MKALVPRKHHPDREVACPKCGAAVQQPCSSSRGKTHRIWGATMPQFKVHKGRKELADSQRKK
jgi:hypothetical protein